MAFPASALAQSYQEELKAKGFPDSYITKLTELHNKYPNWIFEPLITNLDWQTAVNAERSKHSNQLVQNISLYDSSMFCGCPSCFVNGRYVVREGSNWISASESAVKYYMDPRNWLDEQYIYQFESTSYDGTQTKEGVEAILKGTWMYDSLISYRTTSGGVKIYDGVTKYSDAIMKAANDSGMNAYYLASKIRQENGGPQASATAVNGMTSPFQGIYNYFNIGAYSGAYDGLAWAAGFLKLNKNSTLYSAYDKTTGQVGGTATPISNGQYMTWRADVGNYYRVRLYNESNGNYTEGESGYVLKSDCRTSYIGNTASGLGRPWTNPYKAIYYGAQYISRSFTTQNSGYLQKFNVSPASANKHTNEYMKNVAAASSEALTTYQGYVSANIVSMTKKFIIPVYNNMPEDLTISGLQISSIGNENVTLTWNGVLSAAEYQVQMLINGQWTDYAFPTTATVTVTGLLPGNEYKFRVRAISKSGGNIVYGGYSTELAVSTTPSQVVGVTAQSGNDYVKLNWNQVANTSGYSIYIYSTKKKKFRYYKNVDGGTTASVKLNGLKPNTTYRFKVLAYTFVNSAKCKGQRSVQVTIKTKNNVVSLKKVKSVKKKRIALRWGKVSNISGYQVMWSTTKNFKKNYLTLKVKGASSVTKVIKTSRSKKTYYVKVRAYKTSKGKTRYYPWSKTVKIKVK